jgi:hypothetical protein
MLLFAVFMMVVFASSLYGSSRWHPDNQNINQIQTEDAGTIVWKDGVYVSGCNGDSRYDAVRWETDDELTIKEIEERATELCEIKDAVYSVGDSR